MVMGLTGFRHHTVRRRTHTVSASRKDNSIKPHWDRVGTGWGSSTWMKTVALVHTVCTHTWYWKESGPVYPGVVV